MKPVLEVNNLSVCFYGKKSSEKFIAVDGVSFNLSQGEILGIVGESGSGKSVMALSVPQLLPYPKAFHLPKSSIRFQGKELIGAEETKLQKIRGKNIGFIFQEPMSSLNPLHKVGDQIAEIIQIHNKISAKALKKKVISLMEKVGIPDPYLRYNSYPFELSGGQRQRIMIAMAIANEPQILIADEPTTALDVTIQEQIVNLLIKLKNELNISIIFISHDLMLVHKIADRILVVHKGKIVESGSADQIFFNPQDDYTKKLVSSVLDSADKDVKKSEILLEAKGISVEFPLKKSFWGTVKESIKAVDGVSLQLCKGQTLGLVGESGSGKTTLGHCLAGLCKYSGDVVLPHSFENKRQFHKHVQIVFQDPYNSLNPRLNVFQIISEGLKVHYPDMNKVEQKQAVVEMLHEVGLNEQDMFKYPHEFSGGQRQRIAIARALILKPEIVILDEPTSALDVTIQVQIINLLKKLQKKHQMAYLFISHDMRAVRSISDHISVMKDGQIVETGATDDIFSKPQTAYAQALIKASLLS